MEDHSEADLNAAAGSSSATDEYQIQWLRTLIWATGIISIVLALHLLLAEFLWPAQFASSPSTLVDLPGAGSGQIELHWPGAVAYDAPGVLTLNYLPGEGDASPFEIFITSTSPQLWLAYPSGAPPAAQAAVRFQPGQKRQVELALVNHWQGSGLNPVFPKAGLDLTVQPEGAEVLPLTAPGGAPAGVAVALEPVLPAFFRHKASGAFRDSPLILAISALAWLVTLVYQRSQERQTKREQKQRELERQEKEQKKAEAEKAAEDKQTAAALLRQARQHLIHGDLSQAASRLTELTGQKLETGVDPAELQRARQLAGISAIQYEEIQRLFVFPDGWGEETAGALAAAVRAENSALSFEDQVRLLRDFPTDRCSRPAADAIHELRQLLRASHSPHPRRWPGLPHALGIREPVELSASGLLNPFVAPKAEEEEPFLFCQNQYLFWPGLPAYPQLEKPGTDQPVVCVTGATGSGRTAMARAVSVYLRDDGLLGVYLPGIPDSAAVSAAFSRRLLDFVLANPSHLCLLDSYGQQALADLLCVSLGQFPLRRQVVRLIDTLHQNERAHSQELVQLRLFLDAINNAFLQQSDGYLGLMTLVELARDLQFQHFRLAVDADAAASPGWFRELVVGPRPVFAAAGVQTFLFLPETTYTRWNSQEMHVQDYNMPVISLCWREEGKDWLNQMLLHRWRIYNDTPIQEIPSVYESYQEILSQCDGNPAEFIARWRRRYPPK